MDLLRDVIKETRVQQTPWNKSNKHVHTEQSTRFIISFISLHVFSQQAICYSAGLITQQYIR